MSLIPLPYRILALVALIAALIGGGYTAGLRHERSAWQAADALRAKQDTAQLLAATEAARRRELALQAAFDIATAQRLKEQSNHETQLASLRAAARAGTERLRCPIAALPADPAPANPGIAARPEPEARSSDIVPATADDLFRIGSSIADIVRQRNALIDAYNAARSTCNKEGE